MTEQTWPQKAAELAQAALEKARAERPDLVHHYTTCRNYWADLARKSS